MLIIYVLIITKTGRKNISVLFNLSWEKKEKAKKEGSYKKEKDKDGGRRR